MSNLDLRAIRLALVTQLRTLPQVQVYDRWPGTPQVFPCIIPFAPERIDYARTFGARRPAAGGATPGMDMARWELLCLVGKMSPDAHDVLEGLMSGTGPLSVIECLNANKRLGGAVSSLRVPEISSGMYAVSRNSNDDVMGCDVIVEVMA